MNNMDNTANENQNPSDAPQNEQSAECDDLEYLKNKYLRKNGGTIPSLGKKQLLLNIILLCSVIIASLCAVVWFASPTITLGGDTEKGGARNIFSFLFVGKSSVLEQFRTAVQDIENAVDNADGSSVSALTSSAGFIRLAALFVGGLHILIETVVRCIVTAVHFAKRNSVKLGAAATGNVAQKFSAYIYFSFFGSLSGGSGTNAYYHGYTVGVGMTVGLLIALACLVAVTAINYFEKRKTANAEDKSQFLRSAITLAGYTAVAVLLACIKISGVFMYTLNSGLQAIAYCVQYSFSFKPFLFPLLNIVVFAAAMTLYRQTVSGFTGAFRYLIVFDSELLVKTYNPARPDKFRSRFSQGFIVSAAVSALGVVAVMLLQMPSVGYGWDFGLLPYFVSVFAISATGVALLEILFKSPRPERAASKKRRHGIS